MNRVSDTRTASKQARQPRQPRQAGTLSQTVNALTERCHAGLYLAEYASKPPELSDKPGRSGKRITGIRVASGRIVAVLDRHDNPAFSLAYETAADLGTDGKPVKGYDHRAARLLIKIPLSGTGNTKPVIIWRGEITVSAGYLSYDGDSRRNLTPASYHAHVHIRSVNSGGYEFASYVAAQDMRKPPAQAAYIERLGWSYSQSPGALVTYARVCAENLGHGGRRINGQGPYHYDNDLIFVAQSFTIDGSGAVREDIRSDANNLGIYDLAPPSALKVDEIQQGILNLADALTEIPAHPEIPAALHGQLFMAPFMATEIRAFVPVLLPGVKGSGKTRLSARYDAIQSRTARDVAQIKPALNLGDTTATSKGPKYAAARYGGYSITVDDLLKSTDSTFRRNLQQETLSNLIRSYEAGAGAIARVNKAEDRIEPSESGTLFSNPRITSEIVPDSGSTLDRLILLPYLDKEFGSGPFDKPLALRLSLPGAIESMHHAYSAYVVWAWGNREHIFTELYAKAQAITEAWRLDNSRQADRYAAAITGLLAFTEFATGIAGTPELAATVTSRADAGIAALRLCASAQGSRQEPLDVVMRARLRQMLTAQRVAVPGRPSMGPDGTQERAYTDPWQRTHTETDTGIPEVTNNKPDGVTGYGDLGIDIRDGMAVVPQRATVIGYLRPPKPHGEPGSRDELSGEWVIISPINTGMFDTLCQELTAHSKNIDGHVFTRDEIVDMLSRTGYGAKKRVRWITTDTGAGAGNPRPCIIIRCSWLFDDSEDE